MFSISAQKLRAKLFSFEKHQPNCERTFLHKAGSRYENKKANMITSKIIIRISNLPVSIQIYVKTTYLFLISTNLFCFLENLFLSRLYSSGLSSAAAFHFFRRIAQLLAHLLSKTQQPLDNIRVLRGDIVLLTDIFFKVK